ncbi:D-aminoacyl-tRNA deacylase [Nitrososphaera viennensis]|uniref:D-aminoacyl-tRNA deacylase n=2 Tax=Nitrososphaera viennensis TaxID=1034015 RepID=A0A060HF56_9ARCH|nr:D-aminoacyl-tRNA deacylase [Nitrososphaera viennensis]AIC14253.1 putative D-tyrosyl-tRNA(Tyr) deacylase [Nitrososphaera viennensis EN76]UVS69249.1 D-aminoacyl-tRNA deacylase [Nitrososphaera viennensis]
MRDFILVASSQDLAGVTMVDYLKTKQGFAPDGIHDSEEGQSFSSPAHGARLYVANASLLTLETLDRTFPDARAFVFLSKHRSDSGIPTLTCHCTGNFKDAPFGGNPKEIAVALPGLQKAYLKAVTGAGAPGYDVIIEATHHGPTSLKKPVLFIELGSSEKQWADRGAARAMCDSLLGVLANGIRPCEKVGVAIGGTHYPTKFNKLLLESELGLAAVASKHALEAIDEAMLAQMIEKSAEKVTHIVLDAKGLGSHKDRITKMAESTGLAVLKV